MVNVAALVAALLIMMAWNMMAYCATQLLLLLQQLQESSLGHGSCTVVCMLSRTGTCSAHPCQQLPSNFGMCVACADPQPHRGPVEVRCQPVPQPGDSSSTPPPRAPAHGGSSLELPAQGGLHQLGHRTSHHRQASAAAPRDCHHHWLRAGRCGMQMRGPVLHLISVAAGVCV